MDCVLTLDIGSSSVRALLFGIDGREIAGFGSRIPYWVSTTEAGGWEIGAAELTQIVVQALDPLCAQMRMQKMRPAAVAIDTFWHSILGVAADGKAVTPVLHPFDSRSAAAAKKLALRIDNARQHSRTGCVLHSSYPPAKLLWLSEMQPKAFHAAKGWLSFGEYLFLHLFGAAACSTSMISGSGLWNQNANDYDHEMLDALPIKIEQLARIDEMDRPQTKLSNDFAQRCGRARKRSRSRFRRAYSAIGWTESDLSLAELYQMAARYLHGCGAHCNCRMQTRSSGSLRYFSRASTG